MIILNPAQPYRVIAFTTPQNYAPRLAHLIQLKNWTFLWCPTLTIEPTPQIIAQYLISDNNLQNLSAIAFTSRTGITSFSQALESVETPLLSPYGDTFILSALGKDSELLNEAFVDKLCSNPWRIRVLIPNVPAPSGMVECLGLGRGRRVLCPVPRVVGLSEPPVVPMFLEGLKENEWDPIRVDAYETRWCRDRIGELVEMLEKERIDAIVFTSTAEVEGLLKSLGEAGLDWTTVRRMCPRMVVAAHGPVTAAGSEGLGVGVDVVSGRFDSFHGVVDALEYRWNSFEMLD